MTKLVLENLTKQLKVHKLSYREALILQDKGTNLTNSINNRFDQDSQNLRTLYNWCVIFWNKKDPNLMQLGFTIPKSTAKNPMNPDKIVEFKLENKIFYWQESEKAKNYQLVHKDRFENIEWKIIHYNSQQNYKMNIFLGEYKVRGVNQHGFGEWSDLILINENNEVILENL